MEDSVNDMEIRSQDDDTSAYNSACNSTVSSPTRFSNSENSSKTLTHEPNIQKEEQEKDDYDAVRNSANDIDLHSQEDDMSAYNSAYNSTYSSPTRLSVMENTRKNPGFDSDIRKDKYDATLSSASDIEIRDPVENVSNDDGTTSSSVYLSNIENLINNLTAEPMIQKGEQEKVNSVSDGIDNEAEVRHREEANYISNSSSSPVRLSNSENSINALTGELKIQKVDQEKANSFNDSTDIEVEVRGRGEAKSTDNSSTSPVRLSISENLINDIKDEPDTQKEDQDKGNLVLESNDFEVRGQEEVNSTDHNRFSPVRLSNFEDSSNDIKGEGDTEKKDQKGNSVSDSTDVELRGREGANSTDHSSFSSVPLSDSENVIKALTDETDTQKEDRDIDNSVYDSNDIEVRGREEAKFTDHSSFSPVRLSYSENMINALTGESDTHKENQEKGNSVSCTGKQGEILDCVNDKEDREQSLETNTISKQSDENVELKSKDGEKIGEVLNDREGITVDSLSEGTGEMKTDPKDSTSSKKEERLVLYETQEPKLLVSNVAHNFHARRYSYKT